MKIALATDHNGETLKNEIKKYLTNKEIEVIDLSPENNPLDDYPDFGFKVGEAIKNQEADLGVLLCGTGIGICIAANKVPGIRCAHVTSVNEAGLSKEHNNANVIALSSKTNLNEALKMVDIFINTNFSSEERHFRRVDKINKYETGEYNV